MIDGIRKAIAVVGSQRSGTTLTGQLFGALPNAFVVDEDERVYAWFDAVVAGRNDVDLEQFVLSTADRKYRVPRTVDVDGRRVLRPGVDLVVLKGPNLTFWPSRVARFHADTRVLYPVRDPRATVASMLRQFRNLRALPRQLSQMPAELQERFPEAVALIGDEKAPPHLRFAALWSVKSQLQDAFEAAGLAPVTFRYEDLTVSLEATCRHLCTAVGEPFSTALLHHETALEGEAPGRTDRARAVDDTSVMHWRAALTEEQALEVWRLTAAVATRFGYTASGDLPAPGTPLTAAPSW